MRRSIAHALLAAGIIAHCAAASADQEHTLFMAITDPAGTPVRDMTADEIIVRWDDDFCEVLDLEPVNWPVRVTVFVDNATESEAALPDMREGLRLFLRRLPPDIEVAIATIARRPQFRVQHTTDRDQLEDAIGVIASEGGAATFFDALYEEAERLDRDRERQYLPAIVMVAAAGSEGSHKARPKKLVTMMDRLYENGAVVYTLLLSSPYGVGHTLGRAQSRWGADLAASTRGRYEQTVVSTRFRKLLPEVAADLARKHRLTRHQYRVTYRPPEDASDTPRVQVGSTRTGVVVTPTDNGNIP